MRVALFILYICIAGPSLWGQVNIKVGYGASFPSLKQTDVLLSEYSPSDRVLQIPFGDVSFAHGILLGLRYRTGSFAVEAGWESMSTQKNAVGYRESDDSFDTREYDFGLKGFSFGVEQYIRNVGFGTSLQMMKYQIDRIIGNNELEVVSETQPQLRLHATWVIQESSRVSVVLKPYYQFALKDYDVSALAQDIGASSDVSPESAKLFGLSLIFYNGKKSANN